MNKLLNVEKSQAIAAEIGTKAKAAFDNAHRAALALGAQVDAESQGELQYVQGFLVFAGTPFKPVEHAWLELPESRIDPNLPHFNKKAENLFYFPAQCLTLSQLQDAIEEAIEDYPEDEPLPIYGEAPYEYYGDVMLGGEAYQAAFEAASAKVRELNAPTRK